MIPSLPENVSAEDSLKYYSDILSNLEDQSTIHTNWHTHKQNPAVCWICDIPICARKIAYIAEQIITKSTLDIETELNQVDDSELEIEDESLNRDEEEGSMIPEYDTSDPQNGDIPSEESEL